MAAFPEPGALHAGDRLDRYELLCPLAYGGMAAVWLARQHGHRLLDRLVVVKTILPQFASQEHFQTMFVDEARVAAAIDHPNVARTLDVGEKDELLYIVMEWIDGESLSRLQRAVEKNGARLPAGVVLRLIADSCAGLHAAHELRDKSGVLLNVVHRDVSPQNVLVSAAGVAKLIDFGVSKARDRASEGTSAGQLKGKIRYMSPEQALGRDVDRRADVWSLGAMLYEMLARVPPYDGPNEVATLHRLTSGEPPTPLPPTVPREVAAIIMRALAHDLNERFPTAAAMQEALESAMEAIGATTTQAQVAAFLGGHLHERAAARRRSVDSALAAAAKRERNSNSAPPPDRTSRGALAIDTGSSMAIDPPSQTSTATLRAAAVEWPPLSEGAVLRRRRSWMIALGMGVAVGLLVVGALAARMSSRSHAAAAQPPPAVSLPIPAEPPALTAATVPVAPQPQPQPQPTVVDPSSLATSTARPRPPAARGGAPAPPSKPAPSAAPPKKRDYGF